jgi:hypothetical protein
MEIHSDLAETLVIGVVVCSILIQYHHMTSFTDPIEMQENQDRYSSFYEIDKAILKALVDEPFSSLRDLSMHTYPFKTIIHRYLTPSFVLPFGIFVLSRIVCQTLRKQSLMIYQNNYLVYLESINLDHGMLSLP